MNIFMEKVYLVVRKIPKGKVATYKSIAVLIDSPKSSRAVALALSKNFDPKIPCHRVVRSDGFVGGYNRGGPSQKAKLLRAEGVGTRNGKVSQLLKKIYQT
jgi:O-6-methylguanine DNA methyltransferase